MILAGAALVPALFGAPALAQVAHGAEHEGPLHGEQLVWGAQAERLEYRLGEEDALAWEIDAFAGGDDLRLRYKGEGEYALEEDVLEELENQLFLQTPISDFFDAKVGLRYDAPEEEENRAYFAAGVVGLAPQWAEVDVTGYVSEKGDLALQFDAEYEALISNRLVLVPALEVELPLTDDEATGRGGFGPSVEVGARLSYDLIGRSVAPHVGVNYERAFGETADLLRDEGEDEDALFFIVGTRIAF